MQSNALIVGQDASDSHAEMTAFGMDVVMGQFFLCCPRAAISAFVSQNGHAMMAPT